jgi:hypothetical protein
MVRPDRIIKVSMQSRRSLRCPFWDHPRHCDEPYVHCCASQESFPIHIHCIHPSMLIHDGHQFWLFCTAQLAARIGFAVTTTSKGITSLNLSSWLLKLCSLNLRRSLWLS